MPHAVGAMQRFNETEGYNPRESNVLRMLGYFSLIGLQRVHTLVGDYHGALKAIHPLNLFEVGSQAESLLWSSTEADLFTFTRCKPHGCAVDDVSGRRRSACSSQEIGMLKGCFWHSSVGHFVTICCCRCRWCTEHMSVAPRL